MNQKTLNLNPETSTDYKQFIHSFESFRQAHPELSFKQVMTLFLEKKDQEKSAAAH